MANEGFYPIRSEVRVVSLQLEDIGFGWHIKLHTEPRAGRGKKRHLLHLNDRWNLHYPEPVTTREAVDALLAEAVLQRRLPGID